MEQAFLTAFDRYSDALFRHAAYRLSNRERAVELTQETFLKTWDYVRITGVVRSWKSFLYQTLNNLIIDEYRKSHTESLDELFETAPSTTEALLASDGRAEAEERLDTLIGLAQLDRAIESLSAPYRTVIVLRFVDDFSIREIAELLRVSENVVSVRIHRAIKVLREQFAAMNSPS